MKEDIALNLAGCDSINFYWGDFRWKL
jgi:hypothetical protein